VLEEPQRVGAGDRDLVLPVVVGVRDLQAAGAPRGPDDRRARPQERAIRGREHLHHGVPRRAHGLRQDDLELPVAVDVAGADRVHLARAERGAEDLGVGRAVVAEQEPGRPADEDLERSARHDVGHVERARVGVGEEPLLDPRRAVVDADAAREEDDLRRAVGVHVGHARVADRVAEPGGERRAPVEDRPVGGLQDPQERARGAGVLAPGPHQDVDVAVVVHVARYSSCGSASAWTTVMPCVTIHPSLDVAAGTHSSRRRWRSVT
jgi:hypothetical protein